MPHTGSSSSSVGVKVAARSACQKQTCYLIRQRPGETQKRKDCAPHASDQRQAGARKPARVSASTWLAGWLAAVVEAVSVNLVAERNERAHTHRILTAAKRELARAHDEWIRARAISDRRQCRRRRHCQLPMGGRQLTVDKIAWLLVNCLRDAQLRASSRSRSSTQQRRERFHCARGRHYGPQQTHTHTQTCSSSPPPTTTMTTSGQVRRRTQPLRARNDAHNAETRARPIER